jgi:hypothetical protein
MLPVPVHNDGLRAMLVQIRGWHRGFQRVELAEVSWDY